MRLRRPAPSARALMASTALGCSLAVLGAVAPASAQEACGAQAPGATVTCAAAGGPYAAVTYSNADDLTVAIGAGGVVSDGVDVQGEGDLTVVADEASIGGVTRSAITVISHSGDAAVSAGAVTAEGGMTAVYIYGDAVDVEIDSIMTTGDNAGGVYLGGREDVNGVFGVIRTTGDDAQGLGGHTEGDEIKVAFEAVSTAGERSAGVNLYADNAIVIGGRAGSGERRGSVSTAGHESRGVVAETYGGPVTIELESVETQGDDSTAVDAIGADVTVDVGSISTHGDRSHGVNARGDLVNIVLGEVTTRGDQSHGVLAEGQYGGSVEAGQVRTEGHGSNGVVLSSGPHDAPGELRVEAESVHTLGMDSKGVVVTARSENTPVTIDVGSILTEGHNAAGIEATANGNPLSIQVGSVETRGAGAAAILVSEARQARIVADEIRTSGEDSGGIKVETVAGADVEIEVGDVTLTGGRAIGVEVVTGEPGRVSITADSVSTTGTSTGGDQSHAVVVRNGGETTLDLGSVSTTEARSRGVWVEGASGDIAIDVGEISTRGQASDGVYVFAEGAALTLNAGSVVTRGANAVGLRVEGTGDSAVRIDSIQTSGANAHGVQYVVSDGSEVLIEVGDVATSGEGARGVSIQLPGQGQTATVELRSTGLISTTGAEAHGVEMRGYGDVTLDLAAVSTGGEQASGVWLEVFDTASVAADSIATTGNVAPALTVVGKSLLTLDLGSVVTAGQIAHGVLANAVRLSGVIDRITTTGDDSWGVRARVDDDLDLTVNRVRTSGRYAKGVSLTTLTDDMRASLGDVETLGDDATAISLDAGRDLEFVAGRVATQGARAHGVDAIVDYQAEVHLGAVQTSGAEAFGVKLSAGALNARIDDVLTRGNGSLGVSVAIANDLDISLGRVVTEGDDAKAFHASVQRDARIESGVIQTSGDDAIGMEVSVGRLLELESGVILTSGADAHGAVVAANGDVTARFDEIRTNGAGADGLQLRAAADARLEIGMVNVTGADSIGVFASAQGEMEAFIRRGVSAASGVAVEMQARGPLSLTLDEGAVVGGGEAGLRLASETGTHLIINGTVTASSGLAIDIKGGAAVIDNGSNTIVGRVDLTAQADALNNQGQFLARGVSDFGAGDDVFNNTGVLALTEGTGVRSASFVNLERLNNAGVIDLVNGSAGDFIAISGVLSSQDGNQVRLDLDLTERIADFLQVGALEGATNVMLAVQGRGLIGDTGIVLIESAAQQAGDEVRVETIGGGFVDYELGYANGAFRLFGTLAEPAFEPTKVAAGAQHQWRRGADMVAARFETLADQASAGRRDGKGTQIWVQAFDGSEEFDGAGRRFSVGGETFEADLGYKTSSQGVQFGMDQAVPSPRGDLVLGLLVGQGKTELNFASSGDRTRFDGVGVGAYAHWSEGPLSIGALIKHDMFDLTYDWAEGDIRDKADGHTTGARIEAGWRFVPSEAWFVQPTASASWSTTRLSQLRSDVGDVRFGDTDSLLGSAGLRAGTRVALEGGVLRPYGSLTALHEFDGENASTLVLGSGDVRVRDEAQGTWGRAVLGASYDAAGGLSGFLQAEADFGKVEGFTARIGVSYAW